MRGANTRIRTDPAPHHMAVNSIISLLSTYQLAAFLLYKHTHTYIYIHIHTYTYIHTLGVTLVRGRISNCCSAFLPSASLLLVSLLCLHVWGDVVSACIMSTEPCSEAFGTPDRLVSTHWYYACACVCTCAYCTIMYMCCVYVCLTCILCSRLRSTHPALDSASSHAPTNTMFS